MTYSSINFGPAGNLKSILTNYAKDNDGGKVELRIGGNTGTLSASFYLDNTGRWGSVQLKFTLISEVEGVHDLTFSAKGMASVMSMFSFQLSEKE